MTDRGVPKRRFKSDCAHLCKLASDGEVLGILWLGRVKRFSSSAEPRASMLSFSVEHEAYGLPLPG